jgi:opacity protein-like surface antigen
MKKLLSALVLGISFAGSAIAADLIEPPVIEAPAPIYDVPQSGGWYIRGDVDYGMLSTKGIDYDTLTGSASFNTAKMKGAFSAGAGIGYQVNDYFRTDLTLNYHFKSGFRGSTSGFCAETPAGGGAATFTAGCVSSDVASASVYTLLASAYADLGHYSGFTPYVGAGIGGARVSWGDLTNTATCTATTGNVCVPTVAYTHQGISTTRFAYALHAGASYDISSNLKLDAGYSWTHVTGGDMFRFKGLAPGHIDDQGVMGRDKGINIHEVRVGLRYQFGGSSAACCGGPVYK